MANDNILQKNKVYSMLLIADYTHGTPGWRQYVDTLINNLLDKRPSAGWTKYEHLPKITVSIVDKAETRQQAFDKLSTVKYDVVFVDTMVDGQPNGAAMIGRYKQFQDTSMYIPLIAPTQIKGAVKKDGTVSDGAGIERLYAKGFYNGVNKKDLNLGKLIEMILAGGRSKEDAFLAYGLDYGQAKIEEELHTSSDVGKVENDTSQEDDSSPVMDEMTFLLKTAELFPEFSLNQIKTFVQKADSNYEKLQIVSALFHTKKSLVDPYKWVIDTLVDDDSDTNNNDGRNSEMVSAGQTETSPVTDVPVGAQMPTGNDAMSGVEEPISTVEQGGSAPNDGEKPLNRRQRREQRRRQKAMEEELRTENDVHDGVVDVPISVPVSQETKNMPSIYEKTDVKPDPYMQELEQLQVSGALQERGSFNNGMVHTGVIHGNVTFAKGSMAVIELAVDMETLGLRLPDIYNAPVVIPYSIFGRNDMKKD